MQANSSCRVLIVEDEGLIAHDIERRLQALGHKVHDTVSTAAEAIEAAQGADLVLMDIRIDGPADGIEAAHQIRARHHVPVIFLTAHADRATIQRAKQAAPFGYIVKPLAPAALETSIEMAVYKHRADRELEQREAWLRTALGSAADALILTDADGVIRQMNDAAARLTGWSNLTASPGLAAPARAVSDRSKSSVPPQLPAQPNSTCAIGRPLASVLRLIDAADGEEFGDPVPLAILTGRAVELDWGLRVVSRSGQEFEVEGSCSPVLGSPVLGSGDGSAALGAVVMLRDVTMKRWEERQLRQAQRMETAARMATRVADEYANLLETIRQQADRLVDQMRDFTPARKPSEEILRAATLASQATRRLAAFGSSQITHLEAVSINSILRRMNRLIVTTAGSDITVSFQQQPGAGRIRADVGQLDRLVMHLVQHAVASIDATADRPGTIRLETRSARAPHHGRLENYVVLKLEYSAVESDLERMFEPSSSADASLALPVAHAIVTEHGGYITARTSNGETTIELLLPAVEEERAPLPGARSSHQDTGDAGGESDALGVAEHAAGRAITILLVDPRDRVRSLLHNEFEARGYNLLEASGAEEAVTLCEVRSVAPDLVIASAETADVIARQLATLAAKPFADGGANGSAASDAEPTAEETGQEPAGLPDPKFLRITSQRTAPRHAAEPLPGGEIQWPFLAGDLLHLVEQLLQDPAGEASNPTSQPGSDSGAGPDEHRDRPSAASRPDQDPPLQRGAISGS